MRKLSTIFMLFFAMSIFGCVSLNVEINFPAEEVKEDISDSEKQVRNPDSEPKSLNFTLQSPAMKEILNSRKNRYKNVLQAEYDKGTVGEASDGFLVIRNPDSLDLKTLSELKAVVEAENEDRLEMYNEILLANSVATDNAILEEAKGYIFESIKENLKPGHYYQAGTRGDQIIWKQK